MAFVKVRNHYVYLDRQKTLWLMTAVLSPNERQAVRGVGGNPDSSVTKAFQPKASKFLGRLFDKDRKMFADDFEKIEYWVEEARQELPQLMIDWCEISGRFMVWEHTMGMPIDDSITLTERNTWNKWTQIVFPRWNRPKVRVRLDTNDLMCISGTLDSLLLQFGGGLMTLTRDQLTFMMSSDEPGKSSNESQLTNSSSLWPQGSSTNEIKSLKPLTQRPRFMRTAIAYFISVLLLLFLGGFSVDSLIRMPPYALVLVDTNGYYYSPPCLMEEGFTSIRKISAFAEAEGYEVSWKSELREGQSPGQDCKGSRYLMQEGRSLSGEFLEMIGLLDPLPSRWNANGTWNY